MKCFRRTRLSPVHESIVRRILIRKKMKGQSSAKSHQRRGTVSPRNKYIPNMASRQENPTLVSALCAERYSPLPGLLRPSVLIEGRRRFPSDRYKIHGFNFARLGDKGGGAVEFSGSRLSIGFLFIDARLRVIYEVPNCRKLKRSRRSSSPLILQCNSFRGTLHNGCRCAVASNCLPSGSLERCSWRWSRSNKCIFLPATQLADGSEDRHYLISNPTLFKIVHVLRSPCLKLMCTNS